MSVVFEMNCTVEPLAMLQQFVDKTFSLGTTDYL